MTSLPEFSFIMPTFNRAHCICAAIDSVLAQTYPRLELIIVDDGSTDGTLSLLDSKYSAELKAKKIIIVKGAHGGVCKARNLGLKAASKEWIAYIDTDNTISPNFLASYVQMIKENPAARSFYSKAHVVGSKRCIGRSFDLDELIKQNFIDMGTYVHHKSLIDELGGFDENMTRLVDWELIVRQSKVCTPVFIDIPLLEYCDDKAADRITTTVKLDQNMEYFRKKHQQTSPMKKVSTIIVSYNQEALISDAISSALKQKGQFIHQIFVTDDGSTDKTPDVIAKQTAAHQALITNISHTDNRGLTKNLQAAVAACDGDYIALLEGDDIWSSTVKLEIQKKFLDENPDCSMVFSKAEIFDFETKESSFDRRQLGLKRKLSGLDVLTSHCQNPIINLSTCMFRTKLLKQFPFDALTTRVNEIALSLFMAQHGPIGYLDMPLSQWRMTHHGSWTGLTSAEKHDIALKIRKDALLVCGHDCKPLLEKIIHSLEKTM